MITTSLPEYEGFPSISNVFYPSKHLSMYSKLE